MRNADRSGEVLFDLICIVQPLTRPDVTRIGVSHPDASILHIGESDTTANSDIRREPAGVHEVVKQISEQIVRGNTANPIRRSHNFLLKLVPTLARCTRNVGCLIIVRLPVEVFQLHAETAQRAVRMALCKTVAHRRSGQNARCPVELVLPAAARTAIEASAVICAVRLPARIDCVTCLDFTIAGIDVFITHTGPVVTGSVDVNPRSDVEANVATEVEPLRVCLRPARRYHPRGDDERQRRKGRHVFHCSLLFWGKL